MAQPKDFLYFLTDELGRCYYVNNGVVLTSSSPVPLEITPDGWQDKSVKYARNTRYFGLFRTFTTPLKFVVDAAKIIRKRMYTYGTEEKIFLVIHRLDKTFGEGWVHKFFYRGELDLSKFEDADTYFQTNIMEGDLSKIIKANEATQYELSLDVPEAVYVKMDGHYLNEKRNFITQSAGLLALHLIGILETTREGNAPGLASFTVYADGDYPSSFATDTRYWFLTTQVINDINVSGSMSFQWLNEIGHFIVELHSSTGQIITLFDDNVTVGNHSFDFDEDLNSAADERWFLVGRILGFGSAAVVYGEQDIAITFKSRFPTTFIKALPGWAAAQQLLNKMAGVTGYTFRSEYLSSVWKGLMITSMDAIRGLDGAKIKTSWNDHFDSYNVPCNIEASLQGTVLSVEEKAQAFQSGVVQDLGAVKNLKVKPADDHQYNTIKIGYPNSNTEDVNGRDEFNVTHVYSSPVKRVAKELSLVSKYKASMYEIELGRINLDGKTTTDSSNDNDVYFLMLEDNYTIGTGDEPARYYKLRRDTYDSITGLLNPETAFNVLISPKRCLLTHGNYLRGVFYWHEGSNLVFQTSDKNAELKTVSGGVIIEEKANVNIGTLAAPLFIPLEFEFESLVPKDIIDTMEDSPAGTFQIEYDGEELFGFVQEISIKPANNPAQDVVLLCSPETDLTKLIA